MKGPATIAFAAGLATLICPHANAQTNGAEAQTKQLVQAALKEGQLSYWDAIIQPQTADDLVAAFRKHYGLPASFGVHFTGLSPSNLVTRLEQELMADRLSVDAVSIASLPLAYNLAKTGKLLEYDSPQYSKYGKIFDAGFGKRGYFAFNGAYCFVPMWDPSKNNFTGKSWEDVLAALKTGRFSVGNGATSDSTISTYIGLREALGLDYMKKLAAKKPQFIMKSETIASRVISGEDLMAFMGNTTHAYLFNKKGANLKYLMPSEGIVLLPQASFILKQAAHPAAAKLWVDFMLSEQGQEILVKDEALISGREGFKSPNPEYPPAIDELHLIKVDWANVSIKDLQSARAEWDNIFGQ
jgi:iron(III) transport system substrate-binding protein